MTKTSSHLKWCIVRLGEDMNWWVQETSDPIHWDVDGLSIIDPKQLHHVMDLMDPLRDYGLQTEFFELAFYAFAIKQDLGQGNIKLEPTTDSILDSEDKLFALPDILDEDKSPYADFINHITKLRVKLLNDMIDFDQPLTIEDVEEEIREKENADFMEGKSTHIFNEICDILEYIPHGYELDIDEAIEFEEDLPEVEEDEEDFEGDETMRWGDEDEDADSSDEDQEEQEDTDEEDEEDEEAPKAKKAGKKAAPKPKKVAAKKRVATKKR